MNFRTKIPLSKHSHDLIGYDSKLLLLGSCFAENIGEKLEYFKFQNTVNPFGILFHPLAIENLVSRASNKDYYIESEVFKQNGQWHCYDTHSYLNANTKEDLLENLSKVIDLTNQQLKNSTHIIITLGTAWVYRYIETDSIVANCHKVPQKNFLKELLSVDDISESLASTISLIKKENPEASVIFTVSPIRHIKDGFVENTRSKSHLLSAIHEVIEPRKKLYYFPSYEILMDELRDYRFYAEDMIHPNVLAIKYIWESFKKVWVTEEAHKIMNEIESIQKGMAHKPFNPESDLHQKFLLDLEEKKAILQKKISHIVF